MSTTPPPEPRARLIAPGMSLASCVRAYISRNTVEAPLTEAADRLNHYPASPLCTITWIIEGEVEMIDPPPPDPLPPLERIVFFGPRTTPSVTCNPGPVRVFMAIFYPQAVHTLCGLDIAAWVDRWAPVADALGPDWLQMTQAVMQAPDDVARQAIIEAFLEPRWQAARGTGSSTGDWVRHLANQAASSGLGRGVRNIERRIKAWAGQPMRTLRRMRRAEQSFFNARDGQANGKLSWSDVAAQGGYADQAHLCREARALTGHSPTELARILAKGEESYWIYRIWF